MKNHGQACSSRAPDGGAPESRDPELLWSGKHAINVECHIDNDTGHALLCF